jgi:hypothetical protein
LKEIASFHVRGPSVRYLSEVAPAGTQYVGYLGRHPERLGRDTTWDGRPLRLRGRHFDRGLGMLPRSLVAYRLEPEDARFQALIGLDDQAGERASVVFRVSNEKREDLYTSPTLTRRDEPIELDLDVSESKVLILVVEFGDAGDVQDWADWVEARVVQ